MSSKWFDKDGDPWDRACTYCCNRYDKHSDYTGRRLDYCKVKSKGEFDQYSRKEMGNGCADFRTDIWAA